MLNAVAQTLPTLHGPALARMTGRKTCPVATYLTLAHEAATLDLAGAGAADFRRRFNAYYGVRRNEAWRIGFYAAFQAAKNSAASAGDLFAQVLDEMHRPQGRTEASFASKLVATLRPASPVIDSVVRGFLGRYVALPKISGTESACAFYGWLSGMMSELSASPEARAWSADFDAAFAHVADASGIHPVKKLDFLIWAGAER